MATAETVVKYPRGTYLKDGKRLIYIEGYTDDGDMIAEDCRDGGRLCVPRRDFHLWAEVIPSVE